MKKLPVSSQALQKTQSSYIFLPIGGKILCGVPHHQQPLHQQMRPRDKVQFMRNLINLILAFNCFDGENFLLRPSRSASISKKFLRTSISSTSAVGRQAHISLRAPSVVSTDSLFKKCTYTHNNNISIQDILSGSNRGEFWRFRTRSVLIITFVTRYNFTQRVTINTQEDYTSADDYVAT